MFDSQRSGLSSLDMFPALGDLEPVQCEELLKRNIVGRMAFSLQDRVGIVPVNYVYDEGWIYGRTQPGGKLVPILRNRRVAFEVDEQRGMFSWESVVVHGALYLIDPNGDDNEKTAYATALRLLRRILPGTLGTADPVPFRNQFFRIKASEISGRFAALGGERREATTETMRDDDGTPETDALLRASVVGLISRVFPSGSSKVHVDAFDGIVVLTGIVDTPARRATIEREVLGVDNVVAVVEQLETSFPPRRHPTAVDLATNAVRRLVESRQDAAGNVKVVVEHDWLRAEGTAPTFEVKDAVIRALSGVAGTRGVIDRIHVLGGPV